MSITPYRESGRPSTSHPERQARPKVTARVLVKRPTVLQRLAAVLRRLVPAVLVVAVAVAGSTAQAADKPSVAEATKDLAKTNGLLTVYLKKSRMLVELKNSQFDKDFLVLISIARGIGEGSLLGGMSWGFGDDWLWQFRRVDEDRVHVVRVNTRFTADKDSPEASAVSTAYGDSVLFNLPIVGKGDSSVVIDVTDVFLSDLPQIGMMLPGFQFARDRSIFAEVKGFDENTELKVDATYASRGDKEFDTVPDSRGLTVQVHYSISQLPQTGYKPRLADDRIGYFLTVAKNFSKKSAEEQFTRYINRWDLQKAVPDAPISPPKQPIVFWMENTIPYQYRRPIREGILEWNKAFEKIGFSDAIEVRQQPADATWDPEDVKYNTFRWITAGAGFAMGPSRVNPRTGQILDADIIFDSDFIQYWKHNYEILTPETVAAMTGGPLDIASYEAQIRETPAHLRHSAHCRCQLAHEFSYQLAFGATALQARVLSGPERAALEEQLIMQGLKEVTMHEVGHTLGLRHNFKASTWRTLEEMQDVSKTSVDGLTASVMDYAPVNLAAKGQPQGDFYSQTLGPYDYWAIEYGYKPLSGGTDGEKAELNKIAARCAEDGLAYATDEDTRGIDSDPHSNRFDLGKDPLVYAQRQAELVDGLWENLVDRVVEDGEGYQKARQAFVILLGTHGRSMYFAARNVGGMHVYRDHKGDPNGRAPFEVVDAEKQRASLKLLAEQLFSDEPFDLPPELYNQLATTRWSHWGVQSASRLDVPVHEYISMWQGRVLDQLLSSLTLQRLYDSELKVPADEDCFTVPELLDGLTSAIFAEAKIMEPGDYTNRKPAISSLRRSLQRDYLTRLGQLALGQSSAPEDVETLAYLELADLQGELKQLLGRENVNLDTYSRAHVTESIERIGKILDARLSRTNL